jgi:hypothetical protein
MTTVYSSEAQILKQCSEGRRTRNVECKSYIIANARTNNTAPNRIMADAIQGETVIKGFFVAPCKCRVLRISANGTPYADMAAGGTATAKLTKAVIGTTDVDLCSTMAIGAETVPTLDTAIDATLSTTAGALDLIDGQHVYTTITVSGHNVDTAVAYITIMLEWMSTDVNP